MASTEGMPATSEMIMTSERLPLFLNVKRSHHRRTNKFEDYEKMFVIMLQRFFWYQKEEADALESP